MTPFSSFLPYSPACQTNSGLTGKGPTDRQLRLLHNCQLSV